LNTTGSTDDATEHYGQIVHPTIEDIARMVHAFSTVAKNLNPELKWSDLRIWKMDLKGAYTLLSFRPEDVGLFAMLLTGDIVYLQLAGSRLLRERYRGNLVRLYRVAR
jgi:nitrogen fixation/metabolism regulation signal transduction histidine kinase